MERKKLTSTRLQSPHTRYDRTKKLPWPCNGIVQLRLENLRKHYGVRLNRKYDGTVNAKDMWYLSSSLIFLLTGCVRGGAVIMESTGHPLRDGLSRE